MATGKMTTGRNGEDAAADFLQHRGMRILDRNWRSKGLELDLICEDTSWSPPDIVFVEVRTRDIMGRATPAQSIDQRKRTKLSKAASLYLSRNELWDRACRFDLLGVTKHDNAYEVEHMPDAFEFTGSQGGGNAAWQPW